MIVSFIIVCLNAEKTIQTLLDDLLRQSYDHKKIQCIFIDSDSQDKTKQILEKFKFDNNDKFYKISILENKKKILPCGWNIALVESEGDVILRVDAHSHIPQDFIEKNVYYLMNGENITGGPRKSIIDKDNSWQRTLLLAETSMFGSGIAKYRNSEKSQYVNTLAHAAYKRDVFKKVGGYDERLARTEDNEIHYRMRQAGFKFSFNTDIRSFHHARSSFSKMLRQKYLNGYWIGLTLGVCPRCFSIYHFAPLFLVLIMIAGLILGFSISFLPLCVLLGAYFLADILMSLLSIISDKNFSIKYLLLPILIFLLHMAYGIGTLWGLIKLPFWLLKEENKKCDKIDEVKQYLNNN